jgi:biotin operon repressor
MGFRNNFRYTVFAKKLLGNQELRELKNIQNGYLQPAWKHVLQYDKTAVTYWNNNGRAIKGFRGIAFARELIIDVDRIGTSFDNISKAVSISLEALRIEHDLPDHSFQVFFSGKKGYHIHISTKVFGLSRPLKNLNERMEQLAQRLFNGLPIVPFIDPKPFQANAFARIANSPHHETGLFKIPLTLGELANLNLNQLKSRAQFQVDASSLPKFGSVSEIAGLAQMWNSILTSPLSSPLDRQPSVPDGFRHDTALSLIRKCRARGMSNMETKKFVIDWDKQNPTPMHEERWIKNAVDDWYKISKDWDISYAGRFADNWGDIMYILTHPALDMISSSVLAYIYTRANIDAHEWEEYLIQPGSAIISAPDITSQLGITQYQVRSSIEKLKSLGLIYFFEAHGKGRYITLGQPLRSMRLGQEFSLRDLKLPPEHEPIPPWGAFPRINPKRTSTKKQSELKKES